MSESSALEGGVFVCTGRLTVPSHEIKATIVKNGGKAYDTITKNTTHLIAAEDGLTSAKAIAAFQRDIHIVPEEYIGACLAEGGIINLSLLKHAHFRLNHKVRQSVGHQELEQADHAESDIDALQGGVFFICGCKQPKKLLHSIILRSGGSVADKITKAVTHVISSPESISSSQVQLALGRKIPLVGEEFLQACRKSGGLLNLALNENKRYLLPHPAGTGAPPGGGPKTAAHAGADLGGLMQHPPPAPHPHVFSVRGPPPGLSFGAEDPEHGPLARLFEGCVFSMSGRRFVKTRAALFELLMQHGAGWTESVTKTTTHLLSDGSISSKARDAMEKGLPIVKEDFVHACIQHGQVLQLDRAEHLKYLVRIDFSDSRFAQHARAFDTSKQALKHTVFALTGRLSLGRDEIRAQVHLHGGKISDSVTNAVTHLISTEQEFKLSSKIEAALKKKCPIVTEDFLKVSIASGELIDLTVKANMEKYSLTSRAELLKSSSLKSKTTGRKKQAQQRASPATQKHPYPSQPYPLPGSAPLLSPYPTHHSAGTKLWATGDPHEQGKLSMDPTLPKRPVTAYPFYTKPVTTEGAELNQGLAFQEMPGKVPGQWSSMEAEEREKIRKLLGEGSQRYAEEMAQYKQQQIVNSLSYLQSSMDPSLFSSTARSAAPDIKSALQAQPQAIKPHSQMLLIEMKNQKHLGIEFKVENGQLILKRFSPTATQEAREKLREGDILHKLNDLRIENLQMLTMAKQMLADCVTFTFQVERRLTVAEEMPKAIPMALVPATAPGQTSQMMQLLMKSEDLGGLEFKSENGRLVVDKFSATASQAVKEKLKEGDVLHKLNDLKVENVKMLMMAQQMLSDCDKFTFQIERHVPVSEPVQPEEATEHVQGRSGSLEPETMCITLKNQKELGLDFEDDNGRLVLKKITPTANKDAQEKLQEGDVLLEWNNIRVENKETLKIVQQMVADCKEITFQIERKPPEPIPKMAQPKKHQLSIRLQKKSLQQLPFEVLKGELVLQEFHLKATQEAKQLLREGDVIQKINEFKVDSLDKLAMAIGMLSDDDSVSVQVERVHLDQDEQSFSQAKDPNLPKSAKNAYTFYITDPEVKKGLLANHPTASTQELDKLLGEQWKQETFREKWEAKAREDKKRHACEMEAYQMQCKSSDHPKKPVQSIPLIQKTTPEKQPQISVFFQSSTPQKKKQKIKGCLENDDAPS